MYLKNTFRPIDTREKDQKNSTKFSLKLNRNKIKITMSYAISQLIVFLCICALSKFAEAGPWFTGPLLAPGGHTLPRGHTNLEIYGFDVLTNGQYNQFGKIIPTPLFKTRVALPFVSHGITDWLDIQITLPYLFNSNLGRNYNRLADSTVGIGFQLLEHKNSFWSPDLELTVQETLPTGKYNSLNPQFAGTDSTGLGSYQTLFSLNSQQVTELFNLHYLRTRLSLRHLYSSSVTIAGLSSYGGTLTTKGKISSGCKDSIDLAFEFTLTQNWVAVMEGLVSKGYGKQFKGVFSTENIEMPVTIASGSTYEVALIPALEYNFTQNVGVIGGIWFPIKGKNTPSYTTYALAINMYW